MDVNSDLRLRIEQEKEPGKHCILPSAENKQLQQPEWGTNIKPEISNYSSGTIQALQEYLLINVSVFTHQFQLSLGHFLHLFVSWFLETLDKKAFVTAYEVARRTASPEHPSCFVRSRLQRHRWRYRQQRPLYCCWKKYRKCWQIWQTPDNGRHWWQRHVWSRLHHWASHKPYLSKHLHTQRTVGYTSVYNALQ